MSYAKPNTSRSSWRIAFVLALALFASLSATSVASAAPELKVSTIRPDHVTAGKVFSAFLSVQNVGDEPLDGDLTVRTVYPSGIVPAGWETDNEEPLQCQLSGLVSECTRDVTGVLPGVRLDLRLAAEVEGNASGVLSGGEIEVSGGGSTDTFTEALDFFAGAGSPFEIRSFEVGLADAPTLPKTQAGAHPGEVDTVLTMKAEASAFGDVGLSAFLRVSPAEHLRDVAVHVPAGFVGNPTATPVRCQQSDLVAPTQVPNGTEVGVPNCPPESQVGLAQVDTGELVGVFNLVPPHGYPAAFGFFYQGIVVVLLAQVRPADSEIEIVTEKTNSSVPLPRTEVDLWGIPSDPAHDRLRGACLKGGRGFNQEISDAVGGCELKTRSGQAFLRNPTSCSGAELPWGVELNSHEHPERFISASTSTGAMENCEAVPFDPAISLAPSEHAAHAPSGLDVDLQIPQNTDPEGLAEADLKSAAVTLPEGFTINPPSADGLGACSDVQLRLGLKGPAQCPENSKLGSVEVISPLLEEPIGGTVFLRSQGAGTPESGDLYRLAIELRSDRYGIAIKLPGSLIANERTGQLTAVFNNLPQLPFESMQLHFKTGPRAPLSTPNTCGTHTIKAELVGWNGAVRKIDSAFGLDQNCEALPFAPGFQAGVSNASAGDYSPFALRVTRADGEPNIARIDATLPEGELAKLVGVGVCAGADLATGNCPASSLLGSATVGAGTGANPLYLPQPGKSPTAVYFAGPYKGAPYSALVKVPAQAGPFDLGTVSVRSAIEIDPTSTQVTIKSDPLPQIIGGIPVSYRDIRVNIDRPGYTLNPTSCEPKAVTGAIGSAAGQSAAVADRFQVSDCALLGFKPRLALRLRGGTQRSDYPALRATLRMPKGGANITRVSVALPHSEFLAQNHIRTICTRVQFAAGGGGGEKCPEGSIYGHATAYSPLLDYPLSGPVYLRSSANPLPDLVAALGGQIHVDLVGRIDSKNGGIRTTFASVPDAPVSKFVLSMQGGKKGLLENSVNLCRSTNRAKAKFDGHNGRVAEFNPALKADCTEGKGKRRGGGGAGR